MKEIDAKMDANQSEMRSTICAFRSELEETIQQETKDSLSYVDQKTQNLCSELTEAIEKAQIELQTAEVFLDKRTRDVEEKIASIKEDIASNNQVPVSTGRGQCHCRVMK
jgi:flagellar hook-basal body complex protein FliE